MHQCTSEQTISQPPCPLPVSLRHRTRGGGPPFETGRRSVGELHFSVLGLDSFEPFKVHVSIPTFGLRVKRSFFVVLLFPSHFMSSHLPPFLEKIYLGKAFFDRFKQLTAVQYSIPSAEPRRRPYFQVRSAAVSFPRFDGNGPGERKRKKNGGLISSVLRTLQYSTGQYSQDSASVKTHFSVTARLRFEI